MAKHIIYMFRTLHFASFFLYLFIDCLRVYAIQMLLLFKQSSLYLPMGIKKVRFGVEGWTLRI